MNLITQTYDADKWQLVPKVATPDMQEAISNHTEESDSFASIRAAYKAALAAAPQPETYRDRQVDELIYIDTE